MPQTITFQTRDSAVEFPAEYVKYSELLAEHVGNAYDLDISEDDWVGQLLDSDEQYVIDLPMLEAREIEIYAQWCPMRAVVENSQKLPQYIEEYKAQMRLQKPHITDPPLDMPLPRRLAEDWTVQSLVGEENMELLQPLFRFDYNQILSDHEDNPVPPESPFNSPPSWVLNLSKHEIPRQFPTELLWYWLSEWHFIELNDLEIPFEQLTLNAYLRGEARGEEQQQVTPDTADPPVPIVLDFLCDNIERLTMPETSPSAEGTWEEKRAAAEKRMRDTIFIPTDFPEELTEQWLLARLDVPTVEDSLGTVTEISPEELQTYHEQNMAHLRTTPHTDPHDPLWGICAEIGELICLGAEKFIDPWLCAVGRWRLSEMTDLIRSPEIHMRTIKYYDTPRTRQFLEETHDYSA